MGLVAITLNDRIYRLVCDDGEEDRLVELAGYVKGKVEQVRADVGSAGDERLILMAALMIADELFDARASGGLDRSGSQSSSALGEADPVRRLKAVAAEMASKSETNTPAQPPAPNAAAPKAKRRDVA